MTTLMDEKEILADLIGEDADKIGTIEMDVARLTARGVLVDIDVRGTSMFVTAASYEDLGLPNSALVYERLNKGSKNLIPKSYLKRISSLSVRAHQTLERYSVPIEIFRPYRYVPYTAWVAFRQEWERLAYEWQVVKAKIIENYGEFVDQAAEQFQEIARDAWRTMAARAARRGETFEIDEDVFVDRVTARALEAFPSLERIEEEFIICYRVAMLRPAFGVGETAVAGPDDAEAEAVRREARALMRRQMEALGSPLQEFFGKVRCIIYQDAVELSEGLRKHGRLVGRMAERVENLTKIFRLLNAHGDLELESAILQLEAIIAARKAKHGEADVQNIVSILGKITEIAHDSVVAERERANLARRAATIEL